MGWGWLVTGWRWMMLNGLRSPDGSEATLAGVSPSLLSHSLPASPVYSQDS